MRTDTDINLSSTEAVVWANRDTFQAVDLKWGSVILSMYSGFLVNVHWEARTFQPQRTLWLGLVKHECTSTPGPVSRKSSNSISFAFEVRNSYGRAVQSMLRVQLSNYTL